MKKLALAFALAGPLALSSGCVVPGGIRETGHAIVAGAKKVGHAIVAAVKWFVMPSDDGTAPAEKVGGVLNYFWPGVGTVFGTTCLGFGAAIWGKKRKKKKAEAAEWEKARKAQEAREGSPTDGTTIDQAGEAETDSIDKLSPLRPGGESVGTQDR